MIHNWGYARKIRDGVGCITKNNLKMKVIGAALEKVEHATISESIAVFWREMDMLPTST